VDHDQVLLTTEEQSTLLEMAAAMPAEDWWLALQLVDLGEPRSPERRPRHGLPSRKWVGIPSPKRPLRPVTDGRGSASTGQVLLAAVGLVALIAGAALACTAAGFIAWCGIFALAAGMVMGVCVIVMSEANGVPLGDAKAAGQGASPGGS
jgi:hypothetical protein